MNKMTQPRSLLFLLATMVAFGSARVIAQGPQQPQTGPPPVQEQSLELRAPVVIDGEVLFHVRGVASYSAERRAGEFATRIRRVASTGPEPLLSLEEQAYSTVIRADGVPFVAVLDADAALEGVDRHVLAEAWRRRIADAIAAYRQARQPAVIGRHVVYAIVATLAFLIAVYVGRRLIQRLQARVTRRYGAHVTDVRIQSFHILSGDQVWRIVHGSLNLLRAATFLALLYTYLRWVLSLFPWTRGTSNQLVTLVVDPMQRIGRSIVEMIPDLIFLAILFVIVRGVLRVVELFFDSVAADRVKLRNFEAAWARPTYKLVRVLIIALALVVAYPYVPGSETDAFKGVTLFLGVVLSLGSSSFITNLIAGYSMTYRRAFKVGDRVKIGEHVGAVVRTRLLATHLRTIKNEEVIVPNSLIVGTEVVNFSSFAKGPGLILHTTVGVGYGTPWRQVEAMLIEAAERTPGLLREPRPFVLQLELGTFAVIYEINVYCATPERARVLYTELHRNILDLFNEHGVQIMTPAYESDPDDRKVVSAEAWHAPPAAPPPTLPH